MKFKRASTAFAAMIVIIAAGACNSDLFKAKNVPVITGISADTYEVNPGDSVKIRVSVQNPDDEALQYHWSSDGGQFVPPVNQPEVLWIAPGEGGDYKVTVKVSNADGDSDPASEYVHVRIRQAPEIVALSLSALLVDPGDTLTAAAELKEMDDPTLEYHWSADGGQFLAPADGPLVHWKAPSVGGTYEIRLMVSNDKKESEPAAQQVTVRSYSAPYVRIITPADGDIWRQYSTIDITAEADHQNGVETVSLYVNDDLKSTLDGNDSGDYQFSCLLDEPAGVQTIRIDAVAKITGITGSDSVRIRVEGIVIGK